MITIVIKFIQSPAFAISGMLIFSLEKITAFGPVPEGIQNAQEQAKVAGIISK